MAWYTALLSVWKAFKHLEAFLKMMTFIFPNWFLLEEHFWKSESRQKKTCILFLLLTTKTTYHDGSSSVWRAKSRTQRFFYCYFPLTSPSRYKACIHLFEMFWLDNAGQKESILIVFAMWALTSIKTSIIYPSTFPFNKYVSLHNRT